MDVLDKFLNSISYKFPKGYPDIKNEQDILLLEKELSNFDIKINLKEASLAGRTTNFSQPTGAFYKYVEQNPKSSEIDFETEKEEANWSSISISKIEKLIKKFKFDSEIYSIHNDSQLIIHLKDIKESRQWKF